MRAEPSMLTRNMRRTLTRCCERSIKDFGKLPNMVDISGKDGSLFYQDNDANILAVAHLDYVMKSRPTIINNMVVCPQLDDRLGAWVILNLLPQMECPKYDILLTDNEERGASTAIWFKPSKQYNWIFSFDRAGTDVVCYDYECQELTSVLGDHGLGVTTGTYSDIRDMEELGCKGMNIGTGYHLQHTPQCFANLEDTISNAAKFSNFAKAYQDTRLYHEPSVRVDWYRGSQTVKGYGGYGHGWPESYEEDYERYYNSNEFCGDCGENVLPEWRYCPICGNKLA